MYGIYHDVVINTSKEKVFQAFTTPHHLDKWWTLTSSGKPVLGESYNLNFTEQYNWFAEVVKVEHNKCFFLTMTICSKEWLSTTFGIELESVQNGTLLKFFHINWQERSAEFRKTSYCWALLLNGLKNYLEDDTVIPFENRN